MHRTIGQVIDQTRQDIVSVIENSGLDIAIIELIMRDIYRDVENTKQRMSAVIPGGSEVTGIRKADEEDNNGKSGTGTSDNKGEDVR